MSNSYLFSPSGEELADAGRTTRYLQATWTSDGAESGRILKGGQLTTGWMLKSTERFGVARKVETGI